MASEINLQIRGTLKNPSTGTGLIDEFKPATLVRTQNVQSAFNVIVTTTVAEADVTLTGIATNGYCFLKNLDATDSIKFGPKDTTMKLLGTLKSGDIAAFPLGAAVTLRVVATANTPKLSVTAWND